MMAHSRRERLEVEARRAAVVSLALQGLTQVEICDRLGMDRSRQPTISRDLAAVEKGWRAAAVKDRAAAKAFELAKIGAVEAAAWESWQRSKTEQTSSRTRRRREGGFTTEEAALSSALVS